ncbi:hypothetical protein MES5069_190002 [Mesorhizobium escarrei]|uniref:Transposase n=1 Tax=Mesorhizobium escarrei TaxID=666018 RepID=A0ABM9DN23_9HYPH|nr:hypothetical protein MES5069_190002 [Mesorhizobium escarrei]
MRTWRPASAFDDGTLLDCMLRFAPLANRGFPWKPDGSGGGRRVATGRAAVQADRIQRTGTKRRTRSESEGLRDDAAALEGSAAYPAPPGAQKEELHPPMPAPGRERNG